MRAYYDYTYYRPRHKRYSYMTGNDVEYTYGTSGNETGRFLFWTEDCYGCEHRLCLSNVVSNRMHAAVDEKYSSYYAYDHSGERRVKLTGTNDLLDVNADYMYTASVLKEPTIYPSAYMVMSNRGYTKHYYVGTERVAARIGGGGLYAIDQEHGLSDKSGSVFKQSLEQINDRHLENNDIECIANGLSSNDKLTIDMNEVPERLQAKLITDYDEFRQMIDDAQSIHHNEPDVYFYHTDHLGSASWITDNGGLAVQHLQYLPYGERYVDQRAAGYNERFTFTGKEWCKSQWLAQRGPERGISETGYGYFGVRYYDSDLSGLFLSVDPMADKYPNLSPYAYCAWNPVKLVDPDGEDPVLLGLLEYYGKAKYGNSHWGETQKIGNFHVVPFYDNNNNLIGYNAGRYRSDGSYVTEYQMEPGDLKSFSQKHKLYESAANLVYCAGEPDWSTVAFGSGILSKDGNKKIRFDINNPSPHHNPHIHIETKVNGKWKTNRIWPNDVESN